MPNDSDTAPMKMPEKQSAWVSSRRENASSVASSSACWPRAEEEIRIAVRACRAWPNSCAITTSAAHLSRATIGTDSSRRLL